MEFSDFVERRERCRAVRFMDMSQASEIAKFFNPSSYSVRRSDQVFTLEIETQDWQSGATEKIVCNYGDFIVEGRDNGGNYSDYHVMDRREFRDRFEEASALREFLSPEVSGGE